MHPWADAGRLIAGRYRLEAPIGRGAMGVVWRARDLLLDRDVAVKEVQIAETLTEDERANAYQRTLREAKTAARLNHPGVVTVYDVAEDEGRPWIVMQLVHAQSLDQVLATSGPLAPGRAAEMGRQLLSALTVAHAAGVMHRDVKPSNVLLSRDDRAVLTDFGIATFTGDPRLTQTGMVMGSPGFTAPERIRGDDATPASDLWSLGATLFAAVEGHGPFEQRGSALTTMSAIINEEAPPAPAAGPLGPVIAALLRREPADRPDSATASRMMSEALARLSAPGRPGPGGYQPTAMSAAGQAAEPDPPGPMAADTHGGEPSDAGGTAATAPQPALGDADRYDQAAYQSTEYRPAGAEEHPAAAYDPWGQWGPPAASGPAPPPPDFSSWYDPSPRPGPAPQPELATPPPARSSYQPSYPAVPAPRRRRRASLWVILVLLALLGAGGGAAAVLLLRHNTAGPTTGGGSGSSAAGTLPPSSLQIVDAINRSPGARPAGWATASHQASDGEAAGFTLATPSTWSHATTGHQTYFRDPAANVNILVDLTPHTFPGDMLREARYIKSQSLLNNRFPGYSQIGLAATTIRGTPGSYWKFTWNDDGVKQEAIDLLFVLQTAAGPQSYALYMTAPFSMWSQLRPTFDEAAETFSPLT
jgi:hypothetical protein